VCGGVACRFDAEPRVTVACHCSLCREATGSAFGTWTLVPRDHVRFMRGEQLIVEFQSSHHARRLFCKQCGTTLGNYTTRRPTFMHLAAGTLDQAPVMRVNLHCYTASKAPWFQITDQLPQHEDEPQKRG
jgi:hypothetical protein